MTCRDKKKYRTIANALVAGARRAADPECDTRYFRAYRCPRCRHWHLTSQLPRKATR